MTILDRALRMGEAKQFKRYAKRVEAINAWEPELELLDDEELREQADRLLKQYRHVVQKVNAFEPAFEQLSDTELRAKTEEFRSRHAKGESLDKILPEAFATVREGSKRTLKMRHFDVQLLGGMTLHNG